MKTKIPMITALAFTMAMASCGNGRTMSEPEPDGEIVEVVIPEQNEPNTPAQGKVNITETAINATEPEEMTEQNAQIESAATADEINAEAEAAAE